MSKFISPVYLESIVVGELFNREALHRSLVARIHGIAGLLAPYVAHQPKLLPTSVPFPLAKYHNLSRGLKNPRPSELSVCWIAEKGNAFIEVMVGGRRQGAAKDKKTGRFSVKTQ